MTTLRCLDLDVSINAEPPSLGFQFAHLYEACEVADAPGTTGLTLDFRRTGRTYGLAADGVAIAISSNTSDLFTRASVEIDRACVAASSRGYLLVHASCVARGPRAVLIVGPSGSGKSTLAAALTRAGAEYVGDEVIGIAGGGRTVAAYPKPFKLDGRARRLLGAEGGPPGEELLACSSLGSARASSACARPALVVMPMPVRDTAAEVQTMARADVAELLADQCFNFPAWGARGLVTITEIARACPGVRLTFGNLDAAVDAVDGWLR